ncbi:MAG TPA: sialidase family protein [Candidatus Dormibacteraeota bacterium]|jgi:hypothetical protein|nr:sialidase family protein [Candidatus Dormibacteraeota bacterium]
MRATRGFRRAAILALTPLLALAALPAATATAAGDIPAKGCHREWPVVAHRAGGGAVSLPPGAVLPIACATQTGFPTSETTIAITASGVPVFSPTQTENSVGRSLDAGSTWQTSTPAVEQYTALFNTVDPRLIVDRTTDTLFWVHATGPTRSAPGILPGGIVPPGELLPLAPANGFQVYRSSDSAQTWATADYQNEPMGDWEKIFLGPPRPASTGAPQPTGYPNVIYVCANSPTQVTGPGRRCYRSLDGGATFISTGFLSGLDVMGTCPPLGMDTGVVDSRGIVFEPMSCQNADFIAVSDDETSTYAHFLATPAPANSSLTSGNIQLGIDGSDNLYLVWVATDKIIVSISHDHGGSWGKPMVVSAPGVNTITFPVITTSPGGKLGVAYYAKGSSTATGFNAYLTESFDVLDAQPLFYSATLNDPAHPIFFGSPLGVYPRADYVGAAYDASGGLWAGVSKQFAPADSNGNAQTTGYVGRLVALAGTLTSLPTTSNLPNTFGPHDRAAAILALAGVVVVMVLAMWAAGRFLHRSSYR